MNMLQFLPIIIRPLISARLYSLTVCLILAIVIGSSATVLALNKLLFVTELPYAQSQYLHELDVYFDMNDGDGAFSAGISPGLAHHFTDD